MKNFFFFFFFTIFKKKNLYSNVYHHHYRFTSFLPFREGFDESLSSHKSLSKAWLSSNLSIFKSSLMHFFQVFFDLPSRYIIQCQTFLAFSIHDQTISFFDFLVWSLIVVYHIFLPKDYLVAR